MAFPHKGSICRNRVCVFTVRNRINPCPKFSTLSPNFPKHHIKEITFTSCVSFDDFDFFWLIDFIWFLFLYIFFIVAFQKVVLKNLNKILLKIDILSSKIDNIEKRLEEKPSDNDDAEDMLVNLPLKTEAGIINMEEGLRNGQDAFVIIYYYFNLILTAILHFWTENVTFKCCKNIFRQMF